MSSIDGVESNPLISKEMWTKIKSGAAVAGLAIGTIAICAVSTFACAYAQGMGYAKGSRDGQAGSNTAADNDRGYSGGGFRRNIFDRDEAA